MKGHKILKEKVNNEIHRDVDIANCVSGKDVIKNNIEARCQVIRGELLYNVLLGIPLQVDRDDLDLAVSNIVLTTAGVKSIKKFTSKMIGRKYTANLSIITNEGSYLDLEV